MFRFTLDTSSVIHGAQRQQFASAIDEVVDLAQNGRVGLWLASTFTVDQERAPRDKHEANLRWLQERPVIGRVPAPSRLDYSCLDSGDVLISEEHRELSEKIEGILLPVEYRVGNVSAEDTGKMERWRRRVNDLQHLMAHVMAGNNAFVTSDNGMLKRRDRLRREAGIVVVDPDEAVRLVRSEGADLASQA